MNNKSGFVYIWYDKKHKRYYVGAHWGYHNDGYICSSSWMKQAYKRRPKDFKRKILVKNITSTQKMFEEEQRWLSLIKKEELGIRYYNLNIEWKHWSGKDIKESVGQKISKKMTGKTLPEETKRKISQSLKGKTKTAEHSNNVSKSLIGKKVSEESKEKNRTWHLGKKPTKETIEKRKKSRKGYRHTPETIEKIRIGNLKKHKKDD
jgi:hypothetical protein